MGTRVLPSALLSEGYCPIGHGALERQGNPGWCGGCGLAFELYTDPEWGLGVAIKVWVGTEHELYELYIHTYSMRLFDTLERLDLELEQLHDNTFRTAE